MPTRFFSIMTAVLLAGVWVPASAHVGLAEEALWDAQSHVEDAIEDMNYESDNVRTGQAMGALLTAQASAQRARALLPDPAEQVSAASYERALARLTQAEQNHLEAIQALSKLPQSRSRDEALEEAREALAEVQGAMLGIAPFVS